MSKERTIHQRTHTLLLVAWMVTITLIPLLSIYGRPLQHWVADTFGYTIAAWVIAIALVFFVGYLLMVIRKRQVSIPFIHILWFATVFVVLPLLLDRVEERLHFLTFGLFGALSMLVFKPRLAMLLCLLASGGDELLQYFLADRVGDWRDVAMNNLASVSAGVFIWVSGLINDAEDDPGER